MTKEDMIATLKNVVDYLYNDVGDTWYGDLLDDVLEELKNGDADSVKHGKWIETRSGVYFIDRCSVCGQSVEYDETKYPYCPWCGAKMDD